MDYTSRGIDNNEQNLSHFKRCVLIVSVHVNIGQNFKESISIDGKNKVMPVHRNWRHDPSLVCIECEFCPGPRVWPVKWMVGLLDLINKGFPCPANIKLKHYVHVHSICDCGVQNGVFQTPAFFPWSPLGSGSWDNLHETDPTYYWRCPSALKIECVYAPTH